jgi:DNA-binding MarR family transcriptional regulator
VSLTTPTDQGFADRRPIGFWLKLVDRLIDEGLDAMLGEAGLTRRHATLTEAGAAAHAELLRKVSHSRQRLSAGISPQEYATTIEVLRRMAVNLGWAESS